ncbi:MAG: SPOR domain-containing protein [Pseudomonadota bacterium]
MKCPKCGSDKITRSRRRSLEKLLKGFFPLSPFRCKDCWRRFWAFRNPLRNRTPKIVATILVLCLVLLFTWRQILPPPTKENRESRTVSTKPISRDLTRQEAHPSGEQDVNLRIPKPSVDEQSIPREDADTPMRDHHEVKPDRPSLEKAEESLRPDRSNPQKGDPVFREEGTVDKKIEPVAKSSVQEKEPPKAEGLHSDGVGKGLYRLHISSFKKKTHAEREAQRLKKFGYKAFLTSEKVSGKGWFRVYIGEFLGEKSAQKVGLELRERGVISYFRCVKVDKER